MSRLIFLFLVSFDFGLLICKRNKLLACIYALSISLSPYVQWWFGVCFISEILVFGQAGVLVLKKYLTAKKYTYKLMYGVILSFFAIAYTFSTYPSWQVSCGYIFMIVSIWILYDTKNKVLFHDIYNFIIIGICIGVYLICTFSILQRSMDAINIIKSTVYPGSRFLVTGSLQIIDMFKYALGLWLPVKELTINTNNCEAAQMFDLAPLGIIIACYYIFKSKSRDLLLLLLFILQVVFLSWGFLSWPHWLAKYTLMSNVNRVIFPIGIINVMLLVRTLAINEKIHIKKYALLLIATIGALSGTYFSYSFYPIIFNYKYIVATFVILLLLWLLTLMRKLKCLMLMVALVSIYAGARVNPIARGIDCIYKSPIVNQIEKIAAKDNGLWLSVAGGTTYNNIPIMAGAPTINSICVYPTLNRWYLLDSGQNNVNIYNRYAHIPTRLGNKTNFKLLGGDLFELTLTSNDLKKIGIKHIFSMQDLSSYSNSDVKLNLIVKDNNLYLYDVDY
jgi:hypothetical protein